MNPSQLSAVTSDARFNIVLAGPGSGKTKVIEERAKFLRDRGCLPADMGFFTFTNVGAQVMRKRLLDVIGKPGFVGTLHSFMLAQLRRADPRWTLIGEEDCEEYIDRQAKLIGYRGPAQRLRMGRSGGTHDATVLRVLRAYQDFMREERMLDYDMVLTEGLKLLQSGRASMPPIRFVDEFQDSAPVDAQAYLAGQPSELFVVADSDQSIFRFRGARPENVSDYVRDNRFRLHLLEENYRCADSICRVANAVISTAIFRPMRKNTVSATQFVGNVKVSAIEWADNEAQLVADECRDLIATGKAPGQIAVLCRTNALMHDLREFLTMRGVPVARVDHAKKPRDWRLLLLIVAQYAAPDSWANARMLVREMARIRGDDVEAAERALVAHRDAGRSPFAFFDLPAWEIVRRVAANFRRFGIGAVAQAMLVERLRVYEPSTPAELHDALREDPTARSHEGVNIMTAHGSKGEEFDAVVIPGAELFQSSDPSEMDDERRLMFVALTRARQTVLVTAARRRMVKLPHGNKAVERPVGELFETIAHAAAVHAAITSLKGEAVS